MAEEITVRESQLRTWAAIIENEIVEIEANGIEPTSDLRQLLTDLYAALDRPCSCEGWGCPEPVWDGPYKFRCSMGGSGRVCATHGEFTNPACPVHGSSSPEGE